MKSSTNSSANAKKDLIHKLDYAERARGNITVLFTNSIAQHLGLSATEFECLDTIGNNQPITAGHLAKLCGVTTGGMTGMLDRLEAAGFVRRKRDPKDRRVVLLEQVSDRKTIRRIIQLYKPVSERFEACCENFSADEIAIILRYTQYMNEAVKSLLQSQKAP
jgi:DNA-binding MarR family transcriptional regulator